MCRVCTSGSPLCLETSPNNEGLLRAEFRRLDLEYSVAARRARHNPTDLALQEELNTLRVARGLASRAWEATRPRNPYW